MNSPAQDSSMAIRPGAMLLWAIRSSTAACRLQSQMQTGGKIAVSLEFI